jgi:hypothetical protein
MQNINHIGVLVSSTFVQPVKVDLGVKTPGVYKLIHNLSLLHIYKIIFQKYDTDTGLIWKGYQGKWWSRYIFTA